ncbi:MAG: acetyl-CoA carboxylase biotin carboxyl carrier protein [Candidatus Omnitrophica bacterium]|nr:acetyl-CoA carboxylase biotin carboxyl carrier protein [Candidatus Omnitrophota bacterium]
MNLKEIKDLIKLMNENELGEVEVEQEGSKVKLKKLAASMPATVAMQPSYVHAPAAVAKPVEAQVEAAPAAASKDHLKKIVSPMVGTFYRAPSPDVAPYVEVGQVVEIGQVVCIVEAMKLMNEIKSEVRGKVVEIPAENAHPVEFGQVLFYIEPV